MNDEVDPAKNWEYDSYYVPEVNAVYERLLGLSLTLDLATTFLHERQQYVRQMQELGMLVAKWRTRQWAEKRREDDSARADRSAAIKHKLLGMGYTEADFPINNDAWNKIFRQPTRLSERAWKLARPKLVTLLEQEQALRHFAEYTKRLEERRAEVAPYYSDFVNMVPAADFPFMPTLHNACLLPSLATLLSKNDAQESVTLQGFESTKGQLLIEAQQYIAVAKYDLMEMLHRERRTFKNWNDPMPQYNPTEIEAELAKGSALFVCHHCPLKSALSARDICTHWRTEHPLLQWNNEWPPSEVEDRRRRRKYWPKKLPWVSARRYGEKHARDALEALGLREDASHEELDALVRAGRLVCMCGNPALPPAHESSWGLLTSHVVEEMEWYEGRRALMPYRFDPGSRLRDDHHSFSVCLKVIESFEVVVGPDYRVARDVADELSATLAAEQHPPSCKICHDLTNPNHRYKCLWMPRDVDVLAHHMTTKHGQQLSKDLLVFIYYTGI